MLVCPNVGQTLFHYDSYVALNLLVSGTVAEAIGQIVNREFVMEEVVRTLVGSPGLIAAVPITTLLAGMPIGRKWL